MVIRRVLDYVVRTTGAKLLPGAYQAFRKYDVRITNQLFGKSGGKGFRHGRDLGLIAAEFISDDGDVDVVQKQTEFKTSSRSKYKTYRGHKRGCDCRNCKYKRYNKGRR